MELVFTVRFVPSCQLDAFRTYNPDKGSWDTSNKVTIPYECYEIKIPPSPLHNVAK